MPRPSYSSRFYHRHNTGWGVQIIKLLIMKFSQLTRNKFTSCSNSYKLYQLNPVNCTRKFRKLFEATT
jgi:hypothetical protein